MILPRRYEADPIYQGKRLSIWLRKYPYTFTEELEWRGQCKSAAERREMYRKLRDRHGDEKLGQDVANAHDALIQSGQAAFPVLIEMIKEPRDWSILRNRHVAAARRWLELTETIPERIHPPDRRAVAVTALLDLQESGCDMDPVIPEIKKLTESTHRQTSDCAKWILQALVVPAER